VKQSLAKTVILRMVFGFACTVTVAEIVMLISTLMVTQTTGNAQAVPLVPDYAAHFSSPYIALIVQVLLCGLIGMSFSGCSILFEVERWSIVKAAVLHFVLTAIVWVPVSMFCWGLGRYKHVFISVFISIGITYAATWISRILYYRKETRAINKHLTDLQNSGEEER